MFWTGLIRLAMGYWFAFAWKVINLWAVYKTENFLCIWMTSSGLYGYLVINPKEHHFNCVGYKVTQRTTDYVVNKC